MSYKNSALSALTLLIAAVPAFAQVQTATHLTVGPNPGIVGSDVVFTATITPANAVGSVTFTDVNDGSVYTAPVESGAAKLILLFQAGSYSFTASFVPTDSSAFTGSVSSPVTEPVKPSTTVALNSAPNPALYGKPVTLTARINPSTATGTVTFLDRTAIIGISPISNGAATLVTPLLTTGLRYLTARYSGDANNAPSLSPVNNEGVLASAGAGYGGGVSYPAGISPANIAVGTFHNNTTTDLAVVNTGSNSVQIYLGTGDSQGSFSLGATLTTDNAPTGIAAGDFNMDGNTDLAVASAGGIDLFLGNGDGTFTASVSNPISSVNSVAVLVTDLNNDGIPDLAFTNSTLANVNVMLGVGDGTFNSAVQTATGASPGKMATADLNADGNTDIVIATSTGVDVLFGNGDGTLQAAVPYAAGAAVTDVALKDLNGDAQPDIVAAVPSQNQVDVLLNQGAGVYGTPTAFAAGANPVALATADVNGDGRTDIVVAGQASSGNANIQVLLGNGDGTLKAPIAFNSPAQPQAIAVGEFNGDSKVDIAVVSSPTNELTVLTNGFATLATESGDAQSSPVYVTFANPLRVVAYAFGQTAANVPVAFQAPSSGASGFFDGFGTLITVMTGSDGTATSPAYTPNGVTGADAVTATAGGNTISFNLTNAVQPCTFNVNPLSANLPANGGSALFTVTPSGPGCVWSAATQLPWITVSSGGGVGNGGVSILVGQNNTGGTETGTIYIAGQPVQVQVASSSQQFVSMSVVQGDAQMAPTYTTFSTPLKVQVLTLGQPTANVPVTFTAPNTSASGFFNGAGPTVVAVTGPDGTATAPPYTANGSTGQNVVTATAGVATAQFTLNNAIQPCTFTVSPTALNVDASGGTAAFTVTASGTSCVWSVATVSPNISLGGSGGVGSGAVNVLVAQNLSGAPVSSAIYIAGQLIPVTVDETAQIFQDVPLSAYYFDAVNLLKLKGITAGCSTNPPLYCPTEPITREQAAVFMVRAALGTSNFTYQSQPYFNDVPSTEYSFPYVQKLFELGITAGCGGGDFCPAEYVSRDQMAVFIARVRYNATTMFDYSTTPLFNDIAGDFAFPYIQRIAADSITAGCGNSDFCPGTPIARGDMAIFVMRGAFNVLLPSTEPLVTSITPSTIAAGTPTTVTIQAVNTHFDSSTILNAIPGVTIGSINVTSSLTLTVSLTADSTASAYPVSIYVKTGAAPNQEEAVLPNALTITQ